MLRYTRVLYTDLEYRKMSQTSIFIEEFFYYTVHTVSSAIENDNRLFQSGKFI